jgi:hypothetical protein
MKTDEIKYFLVTYFTQERRYEVDEFGTDHDKAMTAYIEIEERYRGREDLDIVLLGADSLDTVKRTHSSYFGHSDRSALADLFRERSGAQHLDGRPVTVRQRRGPGGSRRYIS